MSATIRTGIARRSASRAALALALACGAVVGTVALAPPALAAKREEAPKADYTKAFVTVYQAAEKQNNSGDHAGAKAQIPAVLAQVKTDDDKNAAGGLLYNIGTGLKEPALQLQGLDMMLASGKGTQAQRGQYNWTGYQIANGDGQAELARKYLQGAIDENYSFDGQLSDGTTKHFEARDLQLFLFESYISGNENEAGLAYLYKLLQAEVAAGRKPPEDWIKRGFSVAYSNDMPRETSQFVVMLIRNYPNKDAWGDGIAVLRNSTDLDNSEMLDVMRLARLTNSLRFAQDYNDYLNSADGRRVPLEVTAIIDQGVAAGLLNPSDVLVAEVKKAAADNIASVKADAAALERDARSAPTAKLALNAGEVYLGLDNGAKAEELFNLALTKPEVDRNLALTRLGMAQVMEGKYAEAKASFAQVEGSRKGIAGLWILYADQKAREAAPAAEAPTT